MAMLIERREGFLAERIARNYSPSRTSFDYWRLRRMYDGHQADVHYYRRPTTEARQLSKQLAEMCDALWLDLI